MVVIENVPVKMAGMNVGSAKIHEDGTIDFIVRPNFFTREMIELFARGLADHIEIKTGCIAAVPKET